MATASPIWPSGLVDAGPQRRRAAHGQDRGPGRDRAFGRQRRRGTARRRPQPQHGRGLARWRCISVAAARRPSRLVTAQPVAAPSTLETRRRECPPSRLSSGSNGTPIVISSRTRSGPSSHEHLDRARAGTARGRPARCRWRGVRPCRRRRSRPRSRPERAMLEESGAWPLVSISTRGAPLGRGQGARSARPRRSRRRGDRASRRTAVSALFGARPPAGTWRRTAPPVQLPRTSRWPCPDPAARPRRSPPAW